MRKNEVLTLAMLLAVLPAMFFACSGKDRAPAGQEGAADPKGALKQVIAADPDREELIRLAQAEGHLMVYTPSSRHSKVGQEFGAKYGITVEATQLGDGEMVEKVSKEAAANIDAADVVYCQDGGRVYAELIEPGYVLNYTPPSLRNIIPKEFQDPQVWDITTKQFIFNSEKSEAQPYQNVWELTEPAWKGRIQFKDPFGEGVNMNFLTMVTKPEIADQIANAYRARYGKDIALTTPNAGYEWIKAFFANGLVLGKSDTTMSEAIGAKGQNAQLAGLFTLNKVRTAAAKNLALKTATAMEPFTGFYYPIYCFIPSNSRSPNAAKLFIEYCLTEGYTAWNELGDYSPNPQNPNTEDPVPLSQWIQWLVGEDPKWCAENRVEVEEFLNSIL
jgi:iron(III) transport system substrate-binding protein